MSQSTTQVAPAAVRRTRESTDVGVPVDDAEAVLSALNDADCRAILDATGDAALSAGELSEACDLPLSTAYRKLDLLTDAGLLDERTRIRRSGKHVGEYARRVEEVLVSVAGDGGLELRVVRGEDAESEPAPASVPTPGSR